jgi:hypothetical protein
MFLEDFRRTYIDVIVVAAAAAAVVVAALVSSEQIKCKL